MSNPTPYLGAVVSAEMEAQELSENALAIRAAIPRQTLRRWLSTGKFDPDALHRVAVVFGTTASDLMARAEEVAA